MFNGWGHLGFGVMEQRGVEKWWSDMLALSARQTVGVLDPHRSEPFIRWNISGHRGGSGSTGRYLAAIWHEDDQTGGCVRVLGQVISHVASETRSVLFSCGLRLFSGARGPSSRTVHADCKPAGL